MRINLKILLLVLILKLFFLFYLFQFQGVLESDNFFDRFTTNDYSSLLGPVNNLIQTGSYELVKSSGISYTERLPGYMFPFVFFRFFLNENISILFLVIYQIFISFIASYLLFSITNKISNNLNLSYLIFIVYNLFSFLIPWELWTVPESLSVSYYIISIYFLIIFFYEGKNLKYLIFSGFFLTMVFFLRGFLFFNFISVLLILILKYLNFQSLKYCLVFIFPFLFFESIWITRNYFSKGEFIPLTTFQILNNVELELNEDYRFDYRYKPTVLKLRKLISCWGGINVHYYKNSEMSFFINNENGIDNFFPKWIFNCGISKEMIYNIQELLNKSFDSRISYLERCKVENDLFKSIDLTINKFNYDSVFHNILSRFKRIKNLTYNNVVADWPIGSFISNHLIIKFYKLIILLIYHLSILISLLFGFIHVFLRFFNFKFDAILTIIYLNSIFLIFVFSFIIDIVEFKYSAILFINSIILCCIYLNKLVKN